MNFDFKKYFTDYGRDFSDGSALAHYYGDCVLTSSPALVACLRGETEIHRALHSIAVYQKKTGMAALSPVSVQVDPLDDIHHWAKVKWQAQFDQAGPRKVEFDISYLLRDEARKIVILASVAHQDEEVMRRDLGIG